jgi:tetratricopeptide (TPR) repeat protein
MITELAVCQEFAGRKEEARATFARAAAAIKPTPDTVVPIDSRVLSAYLAWDYSGLGQTQNALEQAKSAVAEYKDDALAKPQSELILAVIQARAGDTDSALTTISKLLEEPYGITRGDLRFDPIWDPLRNDPRFQKLCEDSATDAHR